MRGKGVCSDVACRIAILRVLCRIAIKNATLHGWHGIRIIVHAVFSPCRLLAGVQKTPRGVTPRRAVGLYLLLLLGCGLCRLAGVATPEVGVEYRD